MLNNPHFFCGKLDFASLSEQLVSLVVKTVAVNKHFSWTLFHATVYAKYFHARHHNALIYPSQIFLTNDTFKPLFRLYSGYASFLVLKQPLASKVYVANVLVVNFKKHLQEPG